MSFVSASDAEAARDIRRSILQGTDRLTYLEGRYRDIGNAYHRTLTDARNDGSVANHEQPTRIFAPPSSENITDEATGKDAETFLETAMKAVNDYRLLAARHYLGVATLALNNLDKLLDDLEEIVRQIGVVSDRMAEDDTSDPHSLGRFVAHRRWLMSLPEIIRSRARLSYVLFVQAINGEDADGPARETEYSDTDEDEYSDTEADETDETDEADEADETEEADETNETGETVQMVPEGSAWEFR